MPDAALLPRLPLERRLKGHTARALDVAAAVIARGGRYLVTRRDPAKHMGGLWEFPGGKRKAGESLAACLVREIQEELGSRVRPGRRLAVVVATTPAGRIRLHFFRCRLAPGPVTPREGQPCRWATAAQLSRLPMPPADAAVAAALRTRSAGPDGGAGSGRASAERAGAARPGRARRARA